MIDVNVTELRRNLHAWLDLARRGQRLRIMLRGRAIAELTAPADAAAAVESARSLLAGSVLRYERPFDPAVAPEDWDANR